MRLRSRIKLGIYIVTSFCLLVSQSQLSETVNVEAAPVEKPLLDAPPSVFVNGPASAFIGEDVNFAVTFDNTDSVPGYGPIIDLEIPSRGADGAPNPDGLSFLSATYLGITVENTAIPVPVSGCVAHPYMMDGTTSLPIQVCGLTVGNTFVALRLPFGSFTPDQPMLTVDVSLSMSNLADLGTDLTVLARGGYQYGYDPLNNFCCGDDPALTLSIWDSDSVTPTLITVIKAYSGPESETTTGPNYPRSYTVTAEIAAGQSISAFNLSDVLPANMQYITGSVTTNSASTCSQPSGTTSGGTLSCNFTNPVSGTVTMTFGYFIPLRDSGGTSILDPDTGDDALSCNNASGGGTWTPIDARDTGSSFTQSPAGCEHTLTDKSVATQKGVTVVGGGQPAPGRILEYTIEIQVSDFFVFDQLVVTDTFSDGQRWDAAFTPTLQILGNPASLDSSGNFNSANYAVAPNYTPADPVLPNDGSTTVSFRLSDEMILRSGNGRLIGGCVPAGGMDPDGSDPDCSAYNNGQTTARIVFRTVIQENFSDTFPSGDRSVDQGDILNNTETVAGRVLDTDDAATPTGYTDGDNSSASITIGRGTLTKSVYAVNGSTTFSAPIRITAGDTVTYRVGYSLITSDFEDLVISDYLPLPIFDATEVVTFNAACTAAPGLGTLPVAGESCLGLADTYHNLPSPITPALTTDSGSNWIKWTYGDYDSTSNTASAIDLLFTVTVEDDPFADGLQLTNQAYASEGSTNGSPGEAASIIQITITEPVMTTTKSVVATDNVDTPAPIFAPALPGAIAFNSPGTPGLRWSGNINSNITPIDSNISGLDAGDLVTFAIFLENEGSGINGAFDITFRDTFDALGFEYPTSGNPNSINLQIYYGNGTGPIPYTLPGGGAASSWRPVQRQWAPTG